MSQVSTPSADNLTRQGQNLGAQQDKPHTVWFWVALFVVFLCWGWVQVKHPKIKSELQPANLYANLHNLALITFAAVIGVVGGKILFTKLADITKSLPVIGRGVAYIAQLFASA